MKKKLLFKFFVFAVIGSLLTVTSCKDYDDDINGLDSEISNAKSTISTMQTQLTALETNLTAAKNEAKAAKDAADAAKTAADAAKVAGDNAAAEAAAAKALANEAKAAANAAKAEAIQVAADELAALKTELEKAIAKKLDITVFDNAMLLLDARIDGIEDGLGILTGQMTAAEEAIADLVKADTELQIQLDALEIYAEATQLLAENNAADIAKAKADIEATQQEILDLWAQLTADKEELLGLIGENAADIATLFTDLDATNQSIEVLKAEIEAELEIIKGDISDIQGEILSIYGEIGDIQDELVTLGNYVKALDRQVKSITFVPEYTSPDGTPQILVRGLYEWEARNNYGFNDVTWDTYWLAKPWNNVNLVGTIYKGYTELTYDVNPSNAKLGIDYTVEGLLEQTSTVVSLKSSNEPLLKYVDAVEKGGKLVVRVLVRKDAYNFNNECFDALDYHPLNSKNSYAYLYDPNGYDSGKNVSLALQVKNIKALEESAERYVVSSEYVKSSFMLEPGFVQFIKGYEDGPVTPYILPMRFNDDAIVLDTYPADIILWNGYEGTTPGDHKENIINLNDYIKGVFYDGFTNKIFDMKTYGFVDHKFVFELINLDSEGVDQSNRYVDLNGETGEIYVKLTDNRATQAAVDRTPVVLAKLMVNGKVYAAGYIKIRITDEFNRNDISFTFDISDYTLDCQSVHSLTAADIAAIDFDQVFNRVELGKKDFFNEYYGESVEIIAVRPPAGSEVSMSNINSLVQFAWNMDFMPETGNKKNFLDIFIQNTIPAGTYAVDIKLHSDGFMPDIVITWNFTVKLPSYTLVANTSIIKNGKIIVNPSIFPQGGKTSAVYESHLNNAFMHDAGTLRFTPFPPSCDNFLTPYFVFIDAPTGYFVTTKTTASSGARAGTEIKRNGSTSQTAPAARIDSYGTTILDLQFYVRLNLEQINNQDGSWGNYPPINLQNSEGLVGKTVSVQPRGYINGQEFNWINLYQKFNVEFTYPLQFVLPTDATVYDQSSNGRNVYVLDLYNPNILVDWNRDVLDVTSVEGRKLIDHYEVDYDYVGEYVDEYTPLGIWWRPGAVNRPGYSNWLWWLKDTKWQETFVTPFVFDVEGALWNINPETGLIEEDNIKYPIPYANALKMNASPSGGHTVVTAGDVTQNSPALFTFTWDNGATGAVQDKFQVAIPVSVSHKWGRAANNNPLKDRLVITVEPGAGPVTP